jgi:hypothetical protein
LGACEECGFRFIPESLFSEDFAKSEVKVYLLAHPFTHHSWHDGQAWCWLRWKGRIQDGCGSTWEKRVLSSNCASSIIARQVQMKHSKYKVMLVIIFVEAGARVKISRLIES